MSAATRIEVVTEGVFTRMILDDPGLEGVAGVLFDEFHERSLDADLGLAFALDAQSVLRPDLRLLVMSATLDGARVAALLGAAAPVIESAGRAYEVQTRHLGRDPRLRMEEQVGRAVLRALEAESGSILAFLPGQGEIRRTESWLAERLDGRSNVLLAPLYGAMETGAQDRAIAPASPGLRKVVLATSIAETSLTIDGVRVVIDSGWARVPRFEPASGLTRLETVRVSRAAADQRRGRAGRTEPGVCYRLWDAPEDRSLAPFARPEMLEADLTGVALDLAAWGARSPDDLAFLDPPPSAAFAEARATLTRLEALDGEGTLTPHGRALARLPLPPRLAHMVLRGAETGQGEHAARIAAVVTERGLGGASSDLTERLERFDRESGRRAEDARTLAARWARVAAPPPRRAEGATAKRLSDGALLAMAWPERIAKARTGGGGGFQLASGRGVFLDPADRLARETWLAVGELGGGGARDRILLAAPLTASELEAHFAGLLLDEVLVASDERDRIGARQVRRLGELVVSERKATPDAGDVLALLMDQARHGGLASLLGAESVALLRARVAFLRGLGLQDWPDLSEPALLEAAAGWLTPLLAGRTSLTQIPAAEIETALWLIVGPGRRRELDRLAPERMSTPAGTSAAVDYAADGGPRVEVRVQELFGLAVHPTVAGGAVPLTLSLLSPARRPVQLTRDLPGFWRGSWREVRTEMRGRYPRHPWPEDPLTAPPTTRVKPRGT